MSHDRGCYCGKEHYEYEDCEHPDCYKQTYVNERTFETKVTSTENYKKRLAILQKIAELNKELRELD